MTLSVIFANEQFRYLIPFLLPSLSASAWFPLFTSVLQLSSATAHAGEDAAQRTLKTQAEATAKMTTTTAQNFTSTLNERSNAARGWYALHLQLFCQLHLRLCSAL